MKIGRISYSAGVCYAVIDGEEAAIIDGDLFGEWNVSKKKVSLDSVKLLAPVEPRQIIGIGRNYYEHAAEMKSDVTEEPLIFIKGVNAVIGPEENIRLPENAPNEVDYEAELVIVIGTTAKNVAEGDAGKYIFGYTCGNDVTARDLQKRVDKQWSRAKSFDTFAPIGPWIVTDIADPQNLDIELKLNGHVMQKSNTSKMIFSCKKLVSYISKSMTLYPGSIIMTGTPAGVGYGRNPRIFLKDGDIVSVEIEKIGSLTNHVVS